MCVCERCYRVCVRGVTMCVCECLPCVSERCLPCVCVRVFTVCGVTVCV